MNIDHIEMVEDYEKIYNKLLMKPINTFILEKLKISKPKKIEYTLFPKSKAELSDMIETEIKKNGNQCSLNHIDVSEITDTSDLFYKSNFNGDISEWDVSNVTNMSSMFRRSDFNQDISDWDVSNVNDMSNMFQNCDFNQDISAWDVSNVTSMFDMFNNSGFNQDISDWEINPTCKTDDMFKKCSILPAFKPKAIF